MKLTKLYINQWRDFINNINTQIYPLTSGQDKLKVLKIIEAIKTFLMTYNQKKYL